MADFNGDGLLDLAISNNNTPPSLYLNQLQAPGNALVLTLEGTASNRSAIGARVTITSQGKTLSRTVTAGAGFASQAEHALHFGLGSESGASSIEVLWPNGETQLIEGPELAQLTGYHYFLREGGSLEKRTALVAPPPLKVEQAP